MYINLDDYDVQLFLEALEEYAHYAASDDELDDIQDLADRLSDD